MRESLCHNISRQVMTCPLLFTSTHSIFQSHSSKILLSSFGDITVKHIEHEILDYILNMSFLLHLTSDPPAKRLHHIPGGSLPEQQQWTLSHQDLGDCHPDTVRGKENIQTY